MTKGGESWMPRAGTFPLGLIFRVPLACAPGGSALPLGTRGRCRPRADGNEANGDSVHGFPCVEGFGDDYDGAHAGTKRSSTFQPRAAAALPRLATESDGFMGSWVQAGDPARQRRCRIPADALGRIRQCNLQPNPPRPWREVRDESRNFQWSLECGGRVRHERRHRFGLKGLLHATAQDYSQAPPKNSTY